ncbi:MAG: SpoIIE family protein phosphatase [Terracidiphilus sp.]
MRQRILTAALVALCPAMLLVAQTLNLPQSTAHPGTPKPHTNAKVVQSAAQPAPANVIDATSLGSPLVLDKDWRVGISSDPNVPSPEFDDSSWPLRAAQPAIEDAPDEDASGSSASGQPGASRPSSPANQRRYAWFRQHIELAPNHGPVSLLIEVPVSLNSSISIGTTGVSPDVFANGIQISPGGPHGSTPQHYQTISRIYQLNVPPSQTSLVLAVRTMDISFGYGSYTTFFAGRTFELGNPGDLDREFELWSNRSFFERLPRLIYSSLLAVLAVFLFALYFAQKGHNEYLWLALHELVQAPIGFIELAGSSARLDSLWYAALTLELALAAAYLFFEFLVAFLSLKRRWYIRWLRYTAPVLAGVGPILLFVGHRGITVALLASIFLCSLLWLIGWSVFIFLTLIAAVFKRNFEAGLLLIPLVLSVVGLVEPIFTTIISEDTGRPYISPLTIQAGPIPIHFASIGDFAGIFVIVLIIFGRFLRIHRDQERVTGELAAARGVQELLIPQEKLATPGFEVDSVYSPANEVGGDFFHVQASEGGLLVVIGDVAGKGLKAAMNVSLIMGALRQTGERSPAKILHSLNHVLVGAQSFTTCQAVWFGANGEMVIANAGHLPPYLNSQEIALPGDLPLGVLASVSYEEARFYLHPGDRLLLLSDGVVEARQPSGELFGFDRLRNFSQQSAFYLAEAAKAFGQQDDITVLTVRREAQAMAA